MARNILLFSLVELHEKQNVLSSEGNFSKQKPKNVELSESQRMIQDYGKLLYPLQRQWKRQKQETDEQQVQVQPALWLNNARLLFRKKTTLEKQK